MSAAEAGASPVAAIACPAIGFTRARLATKLAGGLGALASAAPISSGLLVAAALVVVVASLAAMLLYRAAGVLDLVRLFRAAVVNRRVTDGGTERPGWGVGRFFEPFATQWKPFGATREACAVPLTLLWVRLVRGVTAAHRRHAAEWPGA